MIVMTLFKQTNGNKTINKINAHVRWDILKLELIYYNNLQDYFELFFFSRKEDYATFN